MSVFIKGMKLPKDCRACDFCKYRPAIACTLCNVTGQVLSLEYGTIKFDGRHETCPMTEVDEKDISKGSEQERWREGR